MTNEELTHKVMELDERAARHTEQLKTVFGQLGEIKSLVESVYKLATSVELLTQGQTNLGVKVDGLSRDVDEIKNRPAKKWDNASSVIITAIITAVITFVLTQLGIK